MWLENDKFKEINHAVAKGESTSLLRLFGEIFHPENQSHLKITACPKCQKTLERKMHPYLEYFIHVCPDRHGAWMSPEVSDKVRDLFQNQITECTRKKRSVQLAVFFSLIILGIFTITNGPVLLRGLLSGYQNSKIGPDHWPMRDFEKIPSMNGINASIKNSEEARYLTQIAALLEEAASNRMNLESVLKAPRAAEEYAEGFDIYRKRHKEFLMKLRSVYVPTTLNPFQESLKKAAEAQVAFYGAYTQGKMKHSWDQLSQWLQHPALRTCDQELHAAFDFLVQKYPSMDPFTRSALETRLCWFDIV